MSQHDLHLDASHGSVSSLYRTICECGWISQDSKAPEKPEEEGRLHLEGRSMPWQKTSGFTFAPPQEPPPPGWGQGRRGGE